MVTIMSEGVSVANAVLIINQAETYRLKQGLSARMVTSSLIRPIPMTAFAMIAGMIPIVSGMGERGSHVAPLGQAVIRGLVLSLHWP